MFLKVHRGVFCKEIVLLYSVSLTKTQWASFVNMCVVMLLVCTQNKCAWIIDTSAKKHVCPEVYHGESSEDVLREKHFQQSKKAKEFHNWRNWNNTENTVQIQKRHIILFTFGQVNKTNESQNCYILIWTQKSGGKKVHIPL